MTSVNCAISARAQNSLNDIDVKQEASKAIEKLKEKTGVTVPTDVVNALEGVDVNQVTSVLKDKCAKVSGSDAAYEQAEVSH